MWLQSLIDIQDETRDSAEFLEHVKIDLYPDAVYVFTPKSKILALPRGATPVDFAYAIHSDVGDTLRGGQGQWRAGGAAHRTAQRRRGRGHHRARRRPNPAG
jgi:(p)ppGpp synthase/HD superfamily hydrolase